MFAYAIIAFELLILYTVFWYVFLREPQPYRIQGNPWGGYHNGEQEKRLLNGFVRAAQASEKTTTEKAISEKTINERAIYEEWNLDAPVTPSQLMRSRKKGVHASDIVIDEKTSTFAGQFLAKLGDRLNRINVKIP
ncbi:hypothetical protein KBI23_03375 [bacterium]|nr:hypothetical protein [bacterium]MBP9807507.1 hypothetical protein [bacterium]